MHTHRYLQGTMISDNVRVVRLALWEHHFTVCSVGGWHTHTGCINCPLPLTSDPFSGRPVMITLGSVYVLPPSNCTEIK